MSKQITISGDLTSLFVPEKFEYFIKEKKAQRKESSDKYVLSSWNLDGVNIVRYEKKIVIQGHDTEHNSEIIKELVAFDGINLDHKNMDILSSILPKQQNAIICKDCHSPSLTIEAVVEELKIKFKKECNHTDDMNAPLLMINFRILPDINILVSRSLSKLIELNHFTGYEIVVPRLVMNVVDTLDAGKKAGVSEEVTALKSLETQGKIKVIDYDDKYNDSDVKNYLSQEDNYLSDISDITNSILITGDNILKSKVQLKNRPVIFIHPKHQSSIKTMYETRKAE